MKTRTSLQRRRQEAATTTSEETEINSTGPNRPSAGMPPFLQQQSAETTIQKKETSTTSKGINLSELNSAVSLPHILQANQQIRQSPTRLISVVEDSALPGMKVSSEIGNLELLEGEDTSAARLSIEYVIRVSPDFLQDQKRWNQDSTTIGEDFPALRPHEESHIRVAQLALKSELAGNPKTTQVTSQAEARQLLQQSSPRVKEITHFVNAKMDVKTHHGEDFRPERRFEREGKLEREIGKAERLRERNPKRFNRRLERFEETSTGLLD